VRLRRQIRDGLPDPAARSRTLRALLDEVQRTLRPLESRP